MRKWCDACVSALDHCGRGWRCLLEELAWLLALCDSLSAKVDAPQKAAALATCHAFHYNCQELQRALTQISSQLVLD